MIYKKWLNGEHNLVLERFSIDCISLYNISHECLINKIAKAQVISNLKIRKIPRNITNFASSIMRLIPAKKQWFVKSKRSELLCGVSGRFTPSKILILLLHRVCGSFPPRSNGLSKPKRSEFLHGVSGIFTSSRSEHKKVFLGGLSEFEQNTTIHNSS